MSSCCGHYNPSCLWSSVPDLPTPCRNPTPRTPLPPGCWLQFRQCHHAWQSLKCQVSPHCLSVLPSVPPGTVALPLPAWQDSDLQSPWGARAHGSAIARGNPMGRREVCLLQPHGYLCPKHTPQHGQRGFAGEQWRSCRTQRAS